MKALDQSAERVGNAGGCDEKCGGLLDCGHPCTHKCHPFGHDLVVCPAPVTGANSGNSQPSKLIPSLS